MSRCGQWLRRLGGLALILSLPALAQPNPNQRLDITLIEQGVAGYRWNIVRLQRDDRDQAYRLYVATPQQVPPATGFPTLWLLDGHAALMALEADILAELAQRPNPPVVVFVAHDNELRIDAAARAYD